MNVGQAITAAMQEQRRRDWLPAHAVDWWMRVGFAMWPRRLQLTNAQRKALRDAATRSV